jgi:hypothetical protein
MKTEVGLRLAVVRIVACHGIDVEIAASRGRLRGERAGDHESRQEEGGFYGRVKMLPSHVGSGNSAPACYSCQPYVLD